MTVIAPAPLTPVRSPLTEDLIRRCGDRAAGYDRENRFFDEDFEELRQAGYLTLAVPTELGGLGLSLAQVAQEQRRLAYRAPATALAVNMHLYWTGVAADLRRMGDSSLEWLLREAAAGEVFAAGHGEAGNDLPLFLSTAHAERVNGKSGESGYRFWGREQFGSLSPVWTRLGMHAMYAGPDGPQIVHALMPRDTQGYTIEETWDTLGMRATRSDDTVLDGAFVPDKYVARILPASVPDLFVLAIFAWAQCSFSSVYYAIARRALDLAVDGVKRRSSLAVSRSMAYHPEVQHCIAEMGPEVEAMGPHLERIAEDWSSGVDHGASWPMKLVAVKHRCVEGAKKVVDLALTVSGGSGMFNGPSRGDYFTTSDPRYTGCPGRAYLPDYRWVAMEGMVFNPVHPQPAGTVPLYHWYSAERGDNCLTTHPQWTGRIGDTRGGYALFRIEGYVYPTAQAGTVPLHGWWNLTRQDNYTTTQFGAGVYTPQGYGWHRVEGYLPAPDLVVTALQITGPSTVYSADPDIALVPVRFVIKNQGPVAAPPFKVALRQTSSAGTFAAGFVATDTGDVRSDGAWRAYTRRWLVSGGEVIVTGTAYVSRSPRPTSLSADADSCSGEEFMPTYCRVLESDERNNSRSVSISVP